jgi:hypothetical protein
MTAHQVRSYGPSVSTDDADPALAYEIRIAGRLGSHWSAWFDGMTVTTEADGTTVLWGPIVDQAALHGLLQRLRDLGVTLLSLTHVPSADSTEPTEARGPRARPPHEEH